MNDDFLRALGQMTVNYSNLEGMLLFLLTEEVGPPSWAVGVGDFRPTLSK
jgi:hypothetical protein